MNFLITIFLLSVSALVLPWIYYILFAFMRLLGTSVFDYAKHFDGINADFTDKALIVIPVLNGFPYLKSRLTNIVNTCSPNQFDLCIIDDGSDDLTYSYLQDNASQLLGEDWTFHIVRNQKNMGRAACHNLAVKSYHYSYYVLSDLDTLFTATFPVKSFEIIRSDAGIGALSCPVRFVSKTNFGKLFSILFKSETILRSISSFSGLCMKASGPSVIFRRCVWRPLCDFEDVDHSIGFGCLRQGLRLHYDPQSYVYDCANSSADKDLRARSRMTRKSLLSFFNEFRIGIDFASVSSFLSVFGYFLHKPLRFISVPVLCFSFLLIQLCFLHVAVLLPALFLQAFIFPFNYPFVLAASYFSGIVGFARQDLSGSYKPVNSL